MRLEDKIAIVVGAGQTPRDFIESLPPDLIGNGRATAIVYAREGAKVLLVDRDEASVVETRRLIEEAGGEASIHVCDIAEEPECKALVKECVERYGRVDILHNNVGTAAGDRPVDEFDVAVWDQIMQIDLRAMALTCKYALPVMRTQQSGTIINVSSGVSLRAYPQLAYSCAKAGVNSLTQHVAGRGAPYGIRCNAIVLGKVNRPDDEVPIPPLRHVRGSGWDVARTSLFLASDESRFITGVLLPLDGGQSARLEELAGLKWDAT
jgi:NAD(P)-dependent dehydrogenase (short-subunit alcohol dehydrogenase family)